MNGRLLKGLEREKYDAMDRDSWSKLKRLKRSPAHYRHGPAEDSATLKFGRAVHLAVLEPERWLTDVAIWGLTADQKVRNGKTWDAFREKYEGKEIITKTEAEAALSIAKALRADPVAAEHLTGGDAEVTLLWEHNGMPLKSRLDYVTPRALVDLKKTTDASPEAFARSIWTYRYDGQAAFYQQAYFEATGQRLPFFFVAVEDKPPFVSQVYRVPADVLWNGWLLCAALLEQLMFCRDTGSWPGYANGVLDAHLPAVAQRAIEAEDAA